jgi:hypothetical protein
MGPTALAACSSANSLSEGTFSNPGQGEESGVPSDGGPSFDAPPPFDAFGEGTTPPPPPPTVTFVHASPSLSNARLCWAVPGATGAATQTTTDLPFPSGAPMPESNFPGLPVGGAVRLSPATELASAGATSAIELYAIDALVLARQTGGAAISCRELVCLPNASGSPTASCLRPNKDYWHAGTIPAGAIAGSGPTFIALTGCEAAMPDPAASTTRCGADWDPANGNLHVEVLHVASTPEPDAGALAIQAALLSPPLAGAPEAGPGSARIAFGPTGDAGTSLYLTEGQVVPAFPTLLTIGTGLAAFGTLGFEVDNAGLDGGAPVKLWTSLAQAQSLVDPASDPRVYFGANSTYLVAVIGDPSAPSPFPMDGGTYDGRGLHVLVLASLPVQ